VRESGQKLVELDRLNQGVELTANVYGALAQAVTDVSIEIASREGLAEVLTPAYPPVEYTSPRRGLTLALAVVLGGFLGIMTAFVADALDPRRPSYRARSGLDPATAPTP